MICPFLIEERNITKQQNALRIETMSPLPRCILKLPEHWSEGAKQLGGLRWIGSGGSPLVFGICDKKCPPH